MSEAIDRFKNDFAPWFLSLDETTRGYFDEIFRRHPEDMFNVFTGEAAPSGIGGATSITELFGVEGAFSSTDVVPVFGASDIAVDPEAPEVNTEFTIRWSDTNHGGVGSRGHADQLRVVSYETGDVVFESDRIEVAGVGASDASAPNEVKVPGGLPAGGYSIQFTLNVDGAADTTQATVEQGLMGGAEFLFGVGGADPTRPATPEAANTEAVNYAYFYLSSINNTDDQANAQENLALAIESYAGVLPAGLTADDDLMPRILQAAGAVRGLAITDAVAFQAAISADADAAAQVMQQVTGLVVTPAAGAQTLLDLADKAAAAARVNPATCRAAAGPGARRGGFADPDNPRTSVRSRERRETQSEAMSFSTRSSCARNGSLHRTVRWAWSFSLRWTQSTV